MMQIIQIIILKRYVRFKQTGRIIQNTVTPHFPICVLVEELKNQLDVTCYVYFAS